MRRKNRSADTSAKSHLVLVKNYGLYWNRELVDWQRRSMQGKYPKVKRKVNFWFQCGIYVLYTKDNHPIYFGQAGTNGESKLGARLHQHLTDDLGDLWDTFSWYGFQAVRKNKSKMGDELCEMSVAQYVDTESEVNLLEAILISLLPTALRNKQDGKWSKIRAHRYYQDENESVLRKNNKEYGSLRGLEEKVESLTKTLKVLLRQRRL